MDEIFDVQGEVEAFGRILLPYHVTGYRKGVEQALSQLDMEDVFTKAVQVALKQKALYHASLAVGTTKNKLQDLLQTAVNEGQSIDQLGKAIRDTFSMFGKVRPIRIARTELTDVINDGTQETLRKEGYGQKEWSTVIDGRDRETHHEANGQVVGINDLFRVGGESCLYPGDDNLSPESRINCRCACLGAGLPDERKRAAGQRFLRVHGALERSLVVHLRRAFFAERERVLSKFPAP